MDCLLFWGALWEGASVSSFSKESDRVGLERKWGVGSCLQVKFYPYSEAMLE